MADQKFISTKEAPLLRYTDPKGFTHPDHPELEHGFHGFVEHLLNKEDYRAKFDDAGEIVSIAWNEQEQDFEVLGSFVIGLLGLSLDPDKELDSQVGDLVNELEAQLATRIPAPEDKTRPQPKGYPRLLTKDRPRAEAHKDTSPFQHIKNVLASVRTVEYAKHIQDPAEKKAFLVRTVLAVFLHDWGKVIICDGDTYSVHAETSYVMARQLFAWLAERQDYKEAVEKSGISEKQLKLDRMFKIVRYHHLLEMLDKKVLSIEQVREILGYDEKLLAELGLFAGADAESVKDYAKFAFGQIIDALSCIPLAEIEKPYMYFFVSQAGMWMISLYAKAEVLAIEQAQTLRNGCPDIRSLDYLAAKKQQLQSWVAGVRALFAPEISGRFDWLSH